MKKLFSLLTVLIVCVLYSPLAKAVTVDNGYVINQLDIRANLTLQNTVTVTETFDINFSEERHGIFRALPLEIIVNQNINGEIKPMKYKAQVTGVYVDGDPFTTYIENGYYYIRIGDEAATINGPKSYVITYTYDIGDDRISDYDLLFYSLNGPDVSTSINNLTFTFTFPKKTDLTGLQLFTGQYGELQGKRNIDWAVNGQTVTGKSTSALEPGQAVTLYTKLPAGYFEGARKLPYLPFACAAVATVVVFILVLLLFIRLRNKSKPVQTVEFYPPDGISSAEVGYIIDGVAGDNDMTSLVIWLADKGYLEISGEEENITLHRLKALEADSPAYLTLFFNGLFKSSETILLSGLSGEFYESFAASKSALDDLFTGKRKLIDKKAEILSLFLTLFGAVSAAFALSASGFSLSPFTFICGIAFGVLATLSGLVFYSLYRNWRFAKAGVRVGLLLLVVVFGAFSLLAALLGQNGLDLLPLYATLPLAVLGLLSCLLSACIHKPTDYAIAMAGKLLGLRNFIKKAEMPRIVTLLEENPAYFYNILPYAYVFGLTDKWIKNFEALAIVPPSWYAYGAVPSPNLSAYLLMHSLTGSIEASMRPVLNLGQQSGSGFSGSSFGGGGGGGFSGGGFGGGGAGSW